MYFCSVSLNEVALSHNFFLLLVSIAGGLISFNIRYGELETYQPKMEELEKRGNWEKVSEDTLPQFDRDDMPSTSTFFVYKGLKY